MFNLISIYAFYVYFVSTPYFENRTQSHVRFGPFQLIDHKAETTGCTPKSGAAGLTTKMWTTAVLTAVSALGSEAAALDILWITADYSDPFSNLLPRANSHRLSLCEDRQET